VLLCRAGQSLPRRRSISKMYGYFCGHQNLIISSIPHLLLTHTPRLTICMDQAGKSGISLCRRSITATEHDWPLSRGTVIQKPHLALCDHVLTICIANVYTPGANSDARSQPHSTPCQHLGLSACQLMTQVVLDHKFIISGQIPGHTKNQTS
jgi:hypothetical protein